MADKQSPLRAKLAQVTEQADSATRSVLIPESGRIAISGVVELAAALVDEVEALRGHVEKLTAKPKR